MARDYSHVCKFGESWLMYDARGIYVSRVCKVCENEVKSRYRADIFTDSEYWADEPIDED
jgi:hypothetical protein